jgi:hypothetical protein
LVGVAFIAAATSDLAVGEGMASFKVVAIGWCWVQSTRSIIVARLLIRSLILEEGKRVGGRRVPGVAICAAQACHPAHTHGGRFAADEKGRSRQAEQKRINSPAFHFSPLAVRCKVEMAMMSEVRKCPLAHETGGNPRHSCETDRKRWCIHLFSQK